MVDREITLDYEQLLARPMVERDITLTCVSNPVGGPYIGNARWIGAPGRAAAATRPASTPAPTSSSCGRRTA